MCLYGRIQEFAEYPIYKCKRISAFIIDEPVIQIGNQHFWLWFCIEPIHLCTWNIHISEEINMFVPEKFIQSLVEKYGKYTVYTESLWDIYPQRILLVLSLCFIFIFLKQFIQFWINNKITIRIIFMIFVVIFVIIFSNIKIRKWCNFCNYLFFVNILFF